MKKLKWFIIVLICLMMYVGCGPTIHAQSVVRHGNTFVQVVDSSYKFKKRDPLMTKYVYVDVNGIKYPIYVSINGKYFVKKVSKDGKIYPKYLPEVEKIIKETNK